eukprot:6306612-Amphidinium_carterae.1
MLANTPPKWPLAVCRFVGSLRRAVNSIQNSGHRSVLTELSKLINSPRQEFYIALEPTHGIDYESSSCGSQGNGAHLMLLAPSVKNEWRKQNGMAVGQIKCGVPPGQKRLLEC